MNETHATVCRATFVHYFSCAQIYRILEWFPAGERVEPLIILWMRIVDIEYIFTIYPLLELPETDVPAAAVTDIKAGVARPDINPDCEFTTLQVMPVHDTAHATVAVAPLHPVPEHLAHCLTAMSGLWRCEWRAGRGGSVHFTFSRRTSQTSGGNSG